MASTSGTKRPKINQDKTVETMLKNIECIEERVWEIIGPMQSTSNIPPEIEAILSSIKIVQDALYMYKNSEGDATFLQTLRMVGQSSFEAWKEAGFATDLEANMLRINLDAFLESYLPSA